MTKHIGDLRIYHKADAAKYAGIEDVTGYLYISADAQLPVLTSVGGSLYIRADAQLPVLTSVGGVALTMEPIIVTGLDWPVSILDTTMRIGCQEHSLADWAAFDDRQIAEMDGRTTAVRFWSLHKADLLGRAEAAGRVIAAPVDA